MYTITYPYKKINLNIMPVKWEPFCLGLSKLRQKQRHGRHSMEQILQIILGCWWRIINISLSTAVQCRYNSFDMTLYCIQHYNDKIRPWVRVWICKIHPITCPHRQAMGCCMAPGMRPHTHNLPLLLTWIGFKSSMDKQSSHAQYSVGLYYLSIPKLQQLHCWSLGMDK